MKHVFTPAAERALAEAAAWRSSAAAESSDDAAPELLLGLLAEPECRAALELLERRIDFAAVRARWPDLTRCDEHDGSSSATAATSTALASPAWRDLIDRVKEQFWDYPTPLEIATEHLLLGLLLGSDAAGAWLREQGVEAERVEQGIHRRSGLRVDDEEVASATPLDFDDDDFAAPAMSSQAAEPNAASVAQAAPATTSDVRANASASPSPFSDVSRPVAPSIAQTVTSSSNGASPSNGATPIGVWRVIDASSNRAREALRVVEDYVRFVLDDRFLTERLKHVRHELTATVKRFGRPERLLARETQADVGTAVTTASEYVRTDVADAVAANFARLEEALRSLEEFGKLVDPQAAAKFEQARYAVYTLERATEIVSRSLSRLADARLYVLVDGGANESAFEALAASLVSAGVHVLQLRDKKLSDRELLARAAILRRVTAGTPTLFVMNDRPDLAVLANADGVHVGQEELSVKEVRTIVGTEMLIGVSTHSIEQARQAVLDGADYLGVGPTFPSRTKSFDAFAGLEYVRSTAREIRLPFFAIGGIDEANLSQVLAAGASRVAVSGAVAAQAQPAEAARRLLQQLRR